MLDYCFSYMLNTIKKKNKFRFSIYILFLFFLIFFNKFSTTSANANAYKITDLEISEPYNNNFNKEKVIDLAFKKAFEQILLKTTVLIRIEDSSNGITLLTIRTRRFLLPIIMLLVAARFCITPTIPDFILLIFGFSHWTV